MKLKEGQRTLTFHDFLTNTAHLIICSTSVAKVLLTCYCGTRIMDIEDKKGRYE